MGFLVNVFLICIALVIVLTLVAYFCDRFHIGTRPPTGPVKGLDLSKKMIYQNYRGDYARFASIVLDCLKTVHRKCGLDCPSYIEDIFCTETDDRITLTSGGKFIFRYEIAREKHEELFGGAGKRSPGKELKVGAIQDCFQNNLPGCMKGGYGFSGSVSVWQGETNSICLEIGGVERDITPLLIGEIVI